MPSVAETVIKEAAQAAPDSQLLQAASDAVSTVENPSPTNILADVELAWSIISSIKAKLDATHTSLLADPKGLSLMFGDSNGEMFADVFIALVVGCFIVGAIFGGAVWAIGRYLF